MSFTDDCNDADYRRYYIRPAATIRVIDGSTGEILRQIDLQEIRIPRSELPAEWLRLEAEEKQK